MLFRWFKILLIVAFVMVQNEVEAQIYNSSVLDRPGYLFSQNYYPSALQAYLFFDEPQSSPGKRELIRFNVIINLLRLNTPGAEKMLSNFLIDYPSSSLTKRVYLDLANFYFANRKYRYALNWFVKVEEEQVPKNKLPEFNFNKGYSLFYAKYFKHAQPYLEKVLNVSPYQSDAHYYLGHIAYKLEDYTLATDFFEGVSNPNQKDDLKYLQTDMNFRLGRFKKAVELGKESLKTTRDEEEVSQLSKIVGESFFNLGAYAEALPYLEKYKGKRKKKRRKRKWDNTDYYQLGFVFYKLNAFEAAMQQFNKIIGKENELAQNAYYYLAECYLKNDQKTEALNAFKSASRMNFNKVIKENSLLNYAKLSYEIGNPYEQTPNVLIRYLERYPKSESFQTIASYLIDSYTQYGNYDAALKILKENNSYKNADQLQKVNYLKAMDLFRAGQYKATIPHLEEVIKRGSHAAYKTAAYYWSARAKYELNRFDDALDDFKKFRKQKKSTELEEYKFLKYDIAYTYFKLREYNYALNSFREFLRENTRMSERYKFDTAVRMGDCYFALKQYWPAMEQYNAAIRLNRRKAPYSIYQKAMSYGFVNRNDSKIKTLEEFIKNYRGSSLADDALFELGSAYSAAKDNENSIRAYDQLINNYKKSPYLSKAVLKKGLILYNNGKYHQAQAVLRGLAEKLKNNSIGKQALNTLKEIAIERGSVNEFSAWAKSQNIRNFTDDELEKTSFSAAEKQFLENDKKQAENLLENYIQRFPSGANNLLANLYLAEIYFEKGAMGKAEAAYRKIVEQDANEYSEKALVHLIEILIGQKRTRETIPYLEQLLQIASFDENKKFAQSNLMQAYFEVADFGKARNMAQNILNIGSIEEKLKWDALIIRARAALELKDTLSASKAYKSLETAPDREITSEALYFKAERLHEKGDYKASNNVIASMASTAGKATIWGARALLLLSKNYYALNDLFQATYVLESIIDNFGSYPEIVKTAKEMLNAVKEKESDKKPLK